MIAYQIICIGASNEGGCMYRFLMQMCAKCQVKAREQTDETLKRFYKNAAEGFRRKALRLPVGKA